MAQSNIGGGGDSLGAMSAGMDQLTELRLEFNRILLDSIGSKLLNSDVFSWQAGLTQSILGFCLAIAFFQAVLKDEKSMLVEWTKVVLYAWFAMAVAGGVNYREVPFLSSLDNVPANYKVVGKSSLERAIFNNLAYQFDSIGLHFIKATNGANLAWETQKLGEFQDNLVKAMVMCNSSDTDCMINTAKGLRDPEAERDAEETGGLLDTKLSRLLDKIILWSSNIINPATWLFPILDWLLGIFRAFVNQFVLLTFGIIASISMIFLKLLTPFIVIESFRPKVKSMWRDAMSVTLYGFVMNLIIWVSIVVAQGLNEATQKIILNKLSEGAGSGISPGDLYTLLLSNNLTMFVLLFLQIVAMAKTPKFCKMFMNLSLDSIVNIGDALVTAGMGMAKMAGGLALGGATLAAGAAGGMAMKGLSKVGGSAASKLGNSSIGKSIRDKVRGFSDDDPMGGSGFGGGGNSPLSRGGTPSLEKAALADTNMKATTSNQSSVLKKADEKKDEEAKEEAKANTPKTAMDLKKEAWDKKMGMLSSAKDGVGSFLEKMNESRKSKGLTLGNIADKGYDMIWDAMEEGAGSGDATKSITQGLKSANNAVNSQTAREGAVNMGGQIVDESANAAVSLKNRLFKNEPKLSSAERSMMAEQVFQTAAVKGKENTSEADNALLSQNLQDIATGNYSDQRQFTEVMKAMNTKNLSQEQMTQIAEVRKNNAKFDKFANEEESRNNQLLKNIEKEFADTGKIGDKSLSSLSGLTSAGMVDLYQVASMKVTPNGSSNELAERQSFAQAMQKTSQQEMDSVIQSFEQKMQKGQSLNTSELNTATQLFESQKSSLVGDAGRVGSFNNILSNQIESQYLIQDREKTVQAISNISKQMDNKPGVSLQINKEIAALRKEINEAGTISYSETEYQGININGKNISSNSEYQKLSVKEQKLIDEIINKMDLAEKDSLTNQMIGSRTQANFLNSDEFNNLKELIKKIRKA